MIAALMLSAAATAGQTRLQNSNWTVDVAKDGGMTVFHKSGAETRFTPSFVLSYFEKAPKISWDRIPVKGKVDNLNYRIIAWNRTHNIFDALTPKPLKLKKTVASAGKVTFVYADEKEAEFSAVLTLPEDGGEPVLSFSLP